MVKLDPNNVIEVIIYCSDTSASDSIDVEDIDRWHRVRGFECCGYHYVIKTNGEIQLGRSTDYIGAHCLCENGRSIGICYIGGRAPSGIVADTRTYAQKISIAYLLGLLIRQFPNIRYIRGHNDFFTMACPCFDAKLEYKDFISKYKL